MVNQVVRMCYIYLRQPAFSVITYIIHHGSGPTLFEQQLQRKQRKVWVYNLNIKRPDVAANSLSVTFKMLQVTGKISGRK